MDVLNFTSSKYLLFVRVVFDKQTCLDKQCNAVWINNTMQFRTFLFCKIHGKSDNHSCQYFSTLVYTVI